MKARFAEQVRREFAAVMLDGQYSPNEAAKVALDRAKAVIQKSP